MSDRSNPTGSPIKRTIKGEDVTFEELTFAECAEFLVEHRKARREKVKSLMDDAGLNAKERYLELRTLDEYDVGDYDWSLFFNSHEGKLKILQKSLDKAKPGNGKYAKDYSGNDIIELCGAITHTPIIYKQDNPAPKKKAGTDPLAPMRLMPSPGQEEDPKDLPKGFGTP